MTRRVVREHRGNHTARAHVRTAPGWVLTQQPWMGVSAAALPSRGTLEKLLTLAGLVSHL